MKIEDFVHSYTKGIWQIYRIEKYKSINQLTGKIEKKETAFLKRFVSESYKKSFTEESCDISFVVPLSADEKIKLNSFVEKNKDLFDKFCKKIRLHNVSKYVTTRIMSLVKISRSSYN